MVKGKIFNIFGNILETSKEKQNYASGLFNDVYEQANNTIGNIMQQMFNSDLINKVITALPKEEASANE